MDAFWGVTLSVIAISMFWKSQRKRSEGIQYDKEQQQLRAQREREQIAKGIPPPMPTEEEIQRQKDIAELKKRGYDDELIAVVLPTINNGN